MCSYMSVLNACQGIYLVSAFGHVCLFSFSDLWVCFAVSLSGKYFLIPLWEKKRSVLHPPFKYMDFFFFLNNMNTRLFMIQYLPLMCFFFALSRYSRGKEKEKVKDKISWCSRTHFRMSTWCRLLDFIDNVVAYIKNIIEDATFRHLIFFFHAEFCFWIWYILYSLKKRSCLFA